MTELLLFLIGAVFVLFYPVTHFLALWYERRAKDELKATVALAIVRMHELAEANRIPQWRQSRMEIEDLIPKVLRARSKSDLDAISDFMTNDYRIARGKQLEIWAKEGGGNSAEFGEIQVIDPVMVEPIPDGRYWLFTEICFVIIEARISAFRRALGYGPRQQQLTMDFWFTLSENRWLLESNYDEDDMERVFDRFHDE